MRPTYIRDRALLFIFCPLTLWMHCMLHRFHFSVHTSRQGQYIIHNFIIYLFIYKMIVVLALGYVSGQTFSFSFWASGGSRQWRIRAALHRPTVATREELTGHGCEKQSASDAGVGLSVKYLTFGPSFVWNWKKGFQF